MTEHTVRTDIQQLTTSTTAAVATTTTTTTTTASSSTSFSPAMSSRSSSSMLSRRQLILDITKYKQILRNREYNIRRALVEDYKRCDQLIQEEISWRREMIKTIRTNLKGRIRVQRALTSLKPHRNMSVSQSRALHEMRMNLRRYYAEYTTAINDMLIKINSPISRPCSSNNNTNNSNNRSLDSATNKSEMSTVVPLETLYHSKRVCEICDCEKYEHEFAYSMVCTHSYCKVCNLKVLNNTQDMEGQIPTAIKCMSCRIPITDFTHVIKEGERYSIKSWLICEALPDLIKSDRIALFEDESVVTLADATANNEITNDDILALSLDMEEMENEVAEEEIISSSSSSLTSSNSSTATTITLENPVTLLTFANSII
nr:hypothetical protein [Apis mellifera nudivirus]